ncbi:hypothetical protein A1Q1_03710 [Trichosporon asahii var. asahii CBS 2479]|uniref:Uncharacterized protein n=1 Tax=Trichosporon asahii var. asahii (strain ATCC 90039 / CBS 2479 / JCM 2466 / KCTC 7840 / NBRC 103889/ NCYC 2677 / UAMH 7654) TaxID=1186058 RepID=J4U9U7_TRIAS|nr:hypothetical protein A1Q1_03710 [Trichosporon asahii var. asahii CBS 2479]EJT47455.1 hypothetical protein A1Q1_03710 [Trichosporon asahii var. asahii CBS 2479]
MAIPDDSFPHIIDTILDYAVADYDSPSALVQLGLVSRDWHRRLDAKIGHHLLTVDYWVKSTRPGETPTAEAPRGCPALLAERGVQPVQEAGRWRHALRSALFPGHNVADLVQETGASLVHSAKVLTVRGEFTQSHSAAIEALCPSLGAVRVASVSSIKGPHLILPYAPRFLPRAETYVWFRAPDTQFSLQTAAPGWRARSRPSPPHICHEDTKRLVFVNYALPPPYGHNRRTQESRVPRVALPHNPEECVFFLPGLLADGIEAWIRWACELLPAPVTIVIDAQSGSHKEAQIRNDLKEALGMEILGSDKVATLLSEEYRSRVGEERYRTETQFYLSPREKATERQNETLSKLPPGWAFPYDPEA